MEDDGSEDWVRRLNIKRFFDNRISARCGKSATTDSNKATNSIRIKYTSQLQQPNAKWYAKDEYAAGQGIPSGPFAGIFNGEKFHFYLSAYSLI